MRIKGIAQTLRLTTGFNSSRLWLASANSIAANSSEVGWPATTENLSSGLVIRAEYFRAYEEAAHRALSLANEMP